MKTEKFSSLLSPGAIGKMQLRNRIVVTAMGVNLAEPDGTWGERILAYHENQARGGAGLIVTGATGVSWPRGGVQPRQIALSDDTFMPGAARVVAAVHAHGARIAFQLHHAGPNAVTDMLTGRPVDVASVPRSFGTGYVRALLPDDLAVSAFGRIQAINFQPMSRESIGQLVADFAAAALRAKQVGADGVEIHGGHGYIISAFLSPGSNFREDAYGGPLENRARLLIEVIRAIRGAVGDDFPVWVKLDSRENDKSPGITIGDAIATARLAEAAGVDAITVTAYHSTDKGKMDSGSHTPTEPGANLPYAAQIKAALRIPVIASGRIEPEVGEAAIRAGKADFIAMGRKLLADPWLPDKLLAGKADEIRPCIYCNTCISAIFRDESTRCAVNPEMGFEYRDGPAQSPAKKRVVIVGGGPAGMETARRLQLAGHDVSLVERRKQLGGTLRMAALAYAANQRLLDWLASQVLAVGVDVRLDTEATPHLLHTLNPDRVIVATGAVRPLPEIPGNDLPHVFGGDDLRDLMLGESSEEIRRKTGFFTRQAAKVGSVTGLAGNLDVLRKVTHHWMPLGKRIVIIGVELVGLELAEFLAHRGRSVTVLDDAPGYGAGLTILRRAWLLDELVHLGVTLNNQARAMRIEENAVHYLDPDGVEQSVPADHVILAKGATGSVELADRLRAQGFAVDTVGDCNGVGYIEGAMRGAAEIAEMVSAQA